MITTTKMPTTLLPAVVDHFATPQFWERFYSEHVEPFEWYGDFNSLGATLERYLKPSDRILQIGCGNSKLAAELYDNGYRNVWNIDTDQTAINKQNEMNSKIRPSLFFQCAPVQKLPFCDDSMSVVLDKGLLDAIFPVDKGAEMPPGVSPDNSDTIETSPEMSTTESSDTSSETFPGIAQLTPPDTNAESSSETPETPLDTPSPIGPPITPPDSPPEISDAATEDSRELFSEPFRPSSLEHSPRGSQPDLSGIPGDVVKMFNEVSRVLTFGGRYIVVSLAQSHIVRCFTQYFSQQSAFIIRVHLVETSSNSSSDSSFFMPVFLLIATKLRASLPTQVIELMRTLDGKAERYRTVDELRKDIQAIQEFSFFTHACKMQLKEEISVVMVDPEGSPRYRVYLVDEPNPTKRPTSYAAFIIPLGREVEWMFSRAKGRQKLREQCDKTRLAIVQLYRNQVYTDLDAIKEEINDLILRFAPPGLGNAVIDYLSLGAINVLKVLEKGTSAKNGDWVVENIENNKKYFRRLIFLASSNVIQSECALIWRKGKQILDLDNLSCSHHEAMLTALAFHPRQRLNALKNIPLRLVVLGLGGGLLTTFLHRHFQKAQIVAVELDPDVVQIAYKWFGLPARDARLQLIVQDAACFIEQNAIEIKENRQQAFDVVFMDLASGEHDPELSCPPRQFLEQPILKAIKDMLSPNGVLALNLVARDDVLADGAKERLKRVFGEIYVHWNEEELNQVLICPKTKRNLDKAKEKVKNLKAGDDWLQKVVHSLSTLTIC